MGKGNEKFYTHKITFEKVEDFGYYVARCDGKLIKGLTIDKKSNGKFGVYDTKEHCYFGADNTTLKECKEYVKELYGYGLF